MKAVSFVGLELRTLKPYKLSILFLFGFALMLGYFFKSMDMLSGYLMVALVMIMSYPFSISERNDLNTLYATLSINRKTVVRGRYLFAVIAQIICMALVLLLQWILSMLLGSGFQMADGLAAAAMIAGVFSLLISVQFPVYFKYGYNKAKLLALIPPMLIFVVVVQIPVFTGLFGEGFSWSALPQLVSGPAMILVLLFAGWGLLYISCWLSCRIYEKRDL